MEKNHHYDHTELLQRIVVKASAYGQIEGIFTAGSLVNGSSDLYSDIDLGFVSENSPSQLESAFTLKKQLFDVIGSPIYSIERGWPHCKMVAALFGKFEYPPHGIEVDLIFSEVQYAGEQMSYVPYTILFDRNGELKTALEGMPKKIPAAEIQRELNQKLRGLPFTIYEAIKAYHREDTYYLWTLCEEIRQIAIFCGAIENQGPIHTTKKTTHFLSDQERKILEKSYYNFSLENLQAMCKLIFTRLESLKEKDMFELDSQLVLKIAKELF